MSHIFISYSRKDIEFAGKIVKALTDIELDTWIDWKSIPKGEDWELEIHRGIEEADAFLFLISPDSVTSEMCNKEIAHAVKNGKRILPIVVCDTDPKSIHPEISRRNWIFCRDGHDDFNTAIEEIHKTIHTDYEWLKFHTQLLNKALAWEREPDASRFLRGRELHEADELLSRAEIEKDPQPTELQRQYVLGSRRHEERGRNRAIMISIVAATAMLVLGIYAQIQGSLATDRAATAQAASTGQAIQAATAQVASTAAIQQANQRATAQAEAHTQSQMAVSKKLVYQSQNLASAQHSVSLLLAVEANNIHSDTSTLGGLLYALQSKPHNLKYFHFKNEDYTYAPEEVVFSPDNEFVAVLFDFWKSETQKLVIWNVDTGQLEYENVFDYTDLRISKVFFTAQNFLVIETSNQQLITLDFRPKRLVETAAVADVLVASADGTFFVSKDERGYAIWDIATFSQRQVVPLVGSVLTGRGTYLLSHNQERLVFVERYDQPNPYRKVTVVELTTGIVKNSFDLPSGLFDIVINHNASLLAYSIMNDAPIKEVAVLDIDANDILWRAADVYHNLGFFDNETLVGNISEEISLFNARTGQILRQIEPPGVLFWGSDHFSPDGTLLARPLFDSIALVGLASEHFVGRNIDSFGGFITGLGLSQDNQSVYSSTENGFIVTSDLLSGRIQQTLKVIHHDYGTINWSNALDAVHGILITVDSTYEVDCWDIESGNRLAHIENPTGSAIEDYSIQDNKIAIAFSDYVDGNSTGFVQIWNLANQTMMDEFRINPDTELYPYGSWINGIQFSPDGKTLAVAVYASISIYNLESRKFEVHTPILHSNDIHKMAFSQDGRLLISGSSDGSFISWDPITGRQIGKTIFADSSGLLAISPNADILATGGNEVGELMLWNTSTGEQIGLPLKGLDDRIVELAFSSDGSRLAAADASGAITVWQLFPPELSEIACNIANRNLTRAEWDQYVGSVLPYAVVCPNLPVGSEITATPTP